MYKVIFVDDEPLMLEGLKQIIEWQDYGINVAGSATNPEDAMILIDEFEPEIIITDIRMQGSNGLDMIEELNKSGYKGYIIILSGHRDFEYAQRAIENQVFAYLLKPLDINKLKTLVTQIIEKLNETKEFGVYSKGTIEEIIEYVKIHF